MEIQCHRCLQTMKKAAFTNRFQCPECKAEVIVSADTVICRQHGPMPGTCAVNVYECLSCKTEIQILAR